MTIREFIKELRKEQAIQYAVVYESLTEDKLKLYLVLKNENYNESLKCIDIVNKLKKNVNKPFFYYLTDIEEIGMLINNIILSKSRFDIIY